MIAALAFRFDRASTILIGLMVAVSLVTGYAATQGSASRGLLALGALAVLAMPIVTGRPEYLLIGVAIVAPIAIGPFSETAGSGLLRASSLRLPVLLLASLIVLARRRRIALPPSALVAYGTLVAYLSAGLPLSESSSEGLRYVLKLLVPFAIAAAVASMGADGQRFAKGASMVLLGVTLSVDYGMLAFGRGYYGEPGAALRFGGISGSGPSTGFLLALLGVFALIIWLREGDRRALVLWGACFPILLATLTRTSIAAWLLGSMVALGIARRRQLLLAVALGSGAAVIASGSLAARFLSSGQGGWGGVLSSVQSRGLSGISTTGRSALWHLMIQKFKEAPVVGHGAGSPAVFVSDLTHGVLKQPHSEYLSLLVAGGFIGLGLWLLSWWLVSREILRNENRIAISCLAVYALLASVDSPIENYAQGGLAIGLIVGWAFSRQPEVVGVPERPVKTSQ